MGAGLSELEQAHLAREGSEMGRKGPVEVKMAQKHRKQPENGLFWHLEGTGYGKSRIAQETVKIAKNAQSPQKLRRISPQTPPNGNKSRPIALEGLKRRKIAIKARKNAKNGLKTAVFRVWRGLEAKI